MPPPGTFRLPSAALRWTTLPTKLIPPLQTRSFTSRHTKARLLKFAQLTAIFGISGSFIYYYRPLMAYISNEPIPKEIAAAERARLIPTKAKVDFQSAPIAAALVVTPESWEVPGLYLWGFNAEKVADHTAGKKKDKNNCVATPRRMAYFDGQVLRDIKLRKNFGVAVTEKGDLVEWGKGFDESGNPEVILKGMDIKQVAASTDRIIALSSKGEVYSIPAAKKDQTGSTAEPNPGNNGWMPLLWKSATTHFRTITPSKLACGERITSIAGGNDHCLFLTSAGRVFSAASSNTVFPAHGQLGIPGLRWETRPEGPYFQLHEVKELGKNNITQIAAGTQHSLALTNDNQVYAFGDNMFGQLGFPNPWGTTLTDKPVRVGTSALYGRDINVKFTNIYAGGFNSFLAVESPKEQGVTDIWAAGQGQLGSLGTGQWIHMTSAPSRVKGLSALREYSEADKRMLAILAGQISVGATHAAAILEGIGSVPGARDVVVWGGNEHYQLGTGKRNNLPVPSNIPAPVEKEDGVIQRLQVPERGRVVKVGEKGRKVKTVQKLECGEFVSALYTAPVSK